MESSILEIGNRLFPSDKAQLKVRIEAFLEVCQSRVGGIHVTAGNWLEIEILFIVYPGKPVTE